MPDLKPELPSRDLGRRLSATEHHEARVLAALDEAAEKQERRSKALAENKPYIADFAGTPDAIFAMYGENLDQGGQVTINGQVPIVTVRRKTVIKGKLTAPGMDLKSGPVVVKLGDSEAYKGTL